LARVAFHVIRIPKFFLFLLLCAGIAAWAGYKLIPPKGSAPAAAVAQMPGTDPVADQTLVLAEPGKEAPDFTLAGLDGKQVALSSFRGRPVLLYFWASWCSYCIEGMPKLAQLQEDYQDQGLVVLAIDIMERPEKVRKAVADHDIALPVLLDDLGSVTQQYLIKATPTYIFIDRDGIYRDAVVGLAREGALEGRLHPLL